LIQSIVIYSILFGIMLIFARKTAKGEYLLAMHCQSQTKSFWGFDIYIPIILFSVIFGMRYDVGTDHLTYLRKYVDEITTERYEPLFGALTEFCQYLNLHFSIYFGILAFIQIFFFYFSFKNERYLYPFLIFFFFVNEDWMPWMNIIRQSVAMCIWLYSIKFIEEKKLWKYLFWVILAFCFHRSAIILVVFYPLLKSGRDYFNNTGIQLFLLAIVFLINRLFANIVLQIDSVVNLYSSLLGTSSYAESYNTDKLLESFSENEGTGLGFLFKLFISIIIILYSRKLKIFYNSKRYNIIYFFFFLGLLTFYVFPPGAISISRPFRFFYIFQMIMYGYFAYFLYSTRAIKGRLELFYFIIITFLGMFYLSQITANIDSHKWYQFYFQVKDIFYLK